MVSKKKKVIFFCLKSVSGIIDQFSIKKMKKKNFSLENWPKKTKPGGGGGGPRGGWQKTIFFPDFFCYLPLGKPLGTIPDICHFFYTHIFWGLKILHSKVRKFTTKVASRQNSVNHYSRAIFHTLCIKSHIVCNFTHCVWNYTLCVKLHTVRFITHCVKLHTVHKITQCV